MGAPFISIIVLSAVVVPCTRISSCVQKSGNVDPKRDIVIVDGPTDDLDHAALRHRFGGKMGIDATEKTPDDGIGQPWPLEIAMSEETRALVTRRWQEYGL